VVFKKYGVNDLVVHGENGFLVKPGDKKGISKYIVKLINDSKLREKFGKNTVNTASKHDITNTAKETIRLYKSI
jgi:glycosyltransferase involved in cell wall biosynthesis